MIPPVYSLSPHDTRLAPDLVQLLQTSQSRVIADLFLSQVSTTGTLMMRQDRADSLTRQRKQEVVSTWMWLVLRIVVKMLLLMTLWQTLLLLRLPL